MAISFPRSVRSSSSVAFSRSRPSKRISPLICTPGLKRVRPMTVRLETLLPDPDSPTMPSASPLPTLYDTPSTAFTTPSAVGKWTFRSRTSRRGVRSAIGDPRIQIGVHDVHQEVKKDDEERREQHGALHARQVESLDPLERVAADARDVEDRLGEDRTAEQDADVQAEDRDDGRHRAAHAVAHDHASLA